MTCYNVKLSESYDEAHEYMGVGRPGQYGCKQCRESRIFYGGNQDLGHWNDEDNSYAEYFKDFN